MNDPYRNGFDGQGAPGQNPETQAWQPVSGEAWSENPGPFGEGPFGSSNPYPGTGLDAPDGGYDWGAGPAGGPWQPGPGGPPPGPNGGGGPQRKGGNGCLIAIVSVIAVLVVLVGGLLGFFYLSSGSDDDSGQSTAANRPTTTERTQTVETTTEKGRAKNFTAPSSWNKCGGSGAPGNLNLYYAGTSVTSCPFAGAVRDAVVDHYRSTNSLSGTVRAYSPVTGKNYTMSCTDEGDYVTCRGGNNAVVHIV